MTPHSAAQGFSHDNGLLLRSEHVRTGQVVFGFNSDESGSQLRRLPGLRERWKIKTSDTSLVVSPAKAWGFRVDGRTYRFGQMGFVELIYTGDVCVYRFSTTRSVHYYFSRDLESPLEPLTPQRFKRAYAATPELPALPAEIPGFGALRRV